MFVCLWSPAWRTVADSLADLSPALLTVAPRVVTEERRGGLVWVDARGLDAEHIARSALEVLRGLGLSNVRVGVGDAPIVAEVWATAGTGNWEQGTEAACSSLRAAPVPRSPFPVPSSLGSLPVSVLEPDPALAALLDGIGVETCGELAAPAGESVEVRLGADGVRLWKLARGDDDRLVFSPIPRALPHASLEWSDYVLTDTERLLFSVNALLGTVCEKLIDRGSLAREMTLELRLASGNTLTQGIRAGRATASRKTWLRLARAALERMVLPAGVVGLTLYAAAVVTDEGNQGDLFDRGFASAPAVEDAIVQLTDDQGDVVVAPNNSRHPLLEMRTTWRRRESADVPTAGAKQRDLDLKLTLQLLPTPKTVTVDTQPRRDHVVPTRYLDNNEWHDIVETAGPDRVSGGHWAASYSREYFRCVREDGMMVWLFRNPQQQATDWFLHGWWD